LCSECDLLTASRLAQEDSIYIATLRALMSVEERAVGEISGCETADSGRLRVENMVRRGRSFHGQPEAGGCGGASAGTVEPSNGKASTRYRKSASIAMAMGR